MNRSIEHILGLPINLLNVLNPLLPTVSVEYGFWKSRMQRWAHHKMTDRFCERSGKASYTRFKRDFERVDWKTHPGCEYSLFTEDDSSEFHAGVIRINGVGYKLTTYGFARANRLKTAKIREIEERLEAEFQQWYSEHLAREGEKRGEKAGKVVKVRGLHERVTVPNIKTHAQK